MSNRDKNSSKIVLTSEATSNLEGKYTGLNVKWASVRIIVSVSVSHFITMYSDATEGLVEHIYRYTIIPRNINTSAIYSKSCA